MGAGRTQTRVIIVTDGDEVACRAVQIVGQRLGLRVISASGGNPTPVNGSQIAELCHQAPYDPVLVMADDRGRPRKGSGELAIETLANRPDIRIIGILAVASNTQRVRGTRVDASVTAKGEIVDKAVEKDGRCSDSNILEGDTVDILNELDIPVVIGIGDLGKMDGADYLTLGSPVTERAIREILDRNGICWS